MFDIGQKQSSTLSCDSSYFHYKSMGSISCHSNQSPYPIKTKNNYYFPLPVDGVCVICKTIGPAVSEKKIFEIVDDGRTDGRRTDAGACVYYKLTYEPSAQVS